MDLKDRIKQKRKSLRLSAEDLALQLGVNKDNIYKWEKGTKPSNPEDYIKITTWLSGNLETVPKNEVKKEPSAMEILEGLTKGFEAIAETMRSMERKMAQESTQAKINDRTSEMEISLRDVQEKVTTVWERQHLAIEEIRKQFAKLGVQKTSPSPGVRKKGDQNDGNG